MVNRQDRLPPANNDTLPPAERDETLTFFGLWDWSYCRFRLYRLADETPVIVLSECLENQGCSITNGAERAHWCAWDFIQRPWPCRFFEHYPGRPQSVRTYTRLDKEHMDEVTFDQDRECVLVQRPLQLPVAKVQREEFAHANWKPIPIETFIALIKAGRP